MNDSISVSLKTAIEPLSKMRDAFKPPKYLLNLLEPDDLINRFTGISGCGSVVNNACPAIK